MPRWPRWGVAHGLGWKLLILDRALGSLGPVARLGCLGRAYKGRAALCAGGQRAAVALAMIGLTKSSHALAARNQCASYPARDRSPSHSGQAYTVTSYPALRRALRADSRAVKLSTCGAIATRGAL